MLAQTSVCSKTLGVRGRPSTEVPTYIASNTHNKHKGNNRRQQSKLCHSELSFKNVKALGIKSNVVGAIGASQLSDWSASGCVNSHYYLGVPNRKYQHNIQLRCCHPCQPDQSGIRTEHSLRRLAKLPEVAGIC